MPWLTTIDALLNGMLTGLRRNFEIPPLVRDGERVPESDYITPKPAATRQTSEILVTDSVRWAGICGFVAR